MNKFNYRYQQIINLTLSDIYIIFISLILLPLTALALKIKGFKSTKSIFSKLLIKNNTHQIPESNQLTIAKNTSKMVSIAANHGPYRANCLKKTLVTQWLLNKKGIQTQLKIGVNKDERDLNAHSWLEFQGEILNDNADVNLRFSAFDSSKPQKQ